MADTLREALEAALRDDPDDLAAHMAYGDYLMEQGDPRGELVQVQLALEDDKRPAAERAELRAREAELFLEHGDAWLGPMVGLLGERDLERCVILYRRGWLDVLHLDSVTPDLLDAVAACPTAGLLRDFAVDRGECDPSGLPSLGVLRHFRLGEVGDQSRVDGFGVAAALAKMPRLEELQLYTSASELGEVFALPLPRLRALAAHHQNDYPLDVLGDNPSAGNLVSLSCHPHALRNYGDEAYLRQAEFLRFVRSPHLRSLKHLTLHCHEIGDAGVEALIASGLLRRLETLDLCSGNVTDAGAHALARSGQLGTLKKLGLSRNGLTDGGIAALLDAGAQLESDDQYDYYASAERDYLMNGDME